MMIRGQERGPRYTVHSSPPNDRSVQQGASEALGSGNYAISLFAAVHEPGSGTEEASSPAGKGSAYSGSAEGGARCANPLPMPRSQLGAYLINRRSDPLE